MKKSELKAIIKECIFEIFTESFGKEMNTQSISETKTVPTRNQNTQSLRPALNSNRHSIPESLIKHIVPDNGIANKDVMASIFSDTATTTLLEQGKGEGRNPSVDTGIDPTLFEGSKNWATLAFSDSLEKGR